MSRMETSYANLGAHLTELKFDHKDGKEESDRLKAFLGKKPFNKRNWCVLKYLKTMMSCPETACQHDRRFWAYTEWIMLCPEIILAAQVHPMGFHLYIYMYVGFLFVVYMLSHGLTLALIVMVSIEHPGDYGDDDDANWLRELIVYNRQVPCLIRPKNQIIMCDCKSAHIERMCIYTISFMAAVTFVRPLPGRLQNPLEMYQQAFPTKQCTRIQHM